MDEAEEVSSDVSANKISHQAYKSLATIVLATGIFSNSLSFEQLLM